MEDDKKLCPLKFLVKSDPYCGVCNKDRCAWYNTKTKKCAIRDIPEYLDWYKVVGINAR